jgi:hypothetical protein
MILLRSIVANVLIVSLMCTPALADHKATLGTGTNTTNKKLADIYLSQGNSKKAQEIFQRKVGPPCPKCHSTNNVVPIVYRDKYPAAYLANYGDAEFKDAFRVSTCPTGRPTKQWYCLSCHAPFFDKGTGAPIYEQEDH